MLFDAKSRTCSQIALHQYFWWSRSLREHSEVEALFLGINTIHATNGSIMKSYLLSLSLAWLLSAVAAHSIFQELYVNGVSQGHLVGIRVPDYDGVC